MPQGIHEEALRAMVEGGAVREVLVSQHDEKLTLAIRLGGAGSRCLTAYHDHSYLADAPMSQAYPPA